MEKCKLPFVVILLFNFRPAKLGISLASGLEPASAPSKPVDYHRLSNIGTSQIINDRRMTSFCIFLECQTCMMHGHVPCKKV